MMELKNYLENFGLNEKQIEIYLVLLQMGSGSIQEVSQKTKVKRTTTYSVLDVLIQKKLVTITQKGAHRIYFAEDPRKIPHILKEEERLVETKHKNFLEAIPELASFYNLSATKPKIRLYEGIDGLKQVFEETLELKSGEETLAYSTAKLVHTFLDDFIANYIRERVKKGFTQRAIVEDSPEARIHQKNDKVELRQTLIVDKDKFPFSNEINIFRNKLLIVSYKELLGVIIESADIARTQKAIFELAWLGAKQVAKTETI